MIPLRCCVKKYGWGKKGTDSIVGRIVKSQIPSYEVNDETSFAELWISTHPSGPSVAMDPGLKDDHLTLLLYLRSNPHSVGNERIVSKYGLNLPFHLKVLSIQSALSIHAHPNKLVATIALTQFEVFCGFRLHNEIEFLLENVPEFWDTVGEKNANLYLKSSSENKQQTLRELFTTLMTAPAELKQKNLTILTLRWLTQPECPQLENLRQSFLKLSANFANNIRLFGIFFLNHITLQPGEAIYMAPGEPHSFVSGDCVQCYACSSSVGRTLKFKDVHTMCTMLAYSSRSVGEQLLHPVPVDPITRSYVVPGAEYVVDAIEVQQDKIVPGFEYTLDAKDSGSILIVIRGEAQMENQTIFSGFVGFIPANTPLRVTNVQSASLLLYRAYCRLGEQ